MISKANPPLKLALCQAAKSQLMVIDVQDRLCAAMPQDCLELALSNISRLSKAAQLLEVPIIGTEQYPKGLGPTRNAVMESLPDDLEMCEKTGFSCCSASNFEQKLAPKEIRPQVILAGLESHICILQTAAGLQHWGYQVFIVSDAVCSRSPQNRENALNRMRQGGIMISNTESVVFEWMGNANHARFKEVSGLFR